MADSSERPGLFRRLLQGSSEEQRVRTARFPLQAYGKLPIYKDFISVGLTDAGGREFRQWLDRGFSYRWAENEQYRDTEIPPHGFLLRLPESKSCVAGALWGSSDEGGLRKFPFAVFVSFPAVQPAADPLAALHYLVALERRCEEIRDSYAAGASLSAFYKAYRGAEFECALKTREQGGKELKSAISDFPISEFAESLFGARAAARWPGFLAALQDAAGPTNGRGAIRLPLSGLLPRSREVAIWLLWLDRLKAKRRRPVTGVLYTAGRGRGRAVLFSRDLAPEDFLLLHPTHSGHAQVLDIGVLQEASFAAAGSPAAAVTQGPSASPAAGKTTAAPAPPPLDVEPAEKLAPESTLLPVAPSLAEASASAEASSARASEDKSEDVSKGEPAAVPAAPLATAAETSPGALPAAAPETEAGEIGVETMAAEPLPFPEAQAPETPPGAGPRETFSALVVPIAAPPITIAPPAPAAEVAPAEPAAASLAEASVLTKGSEDEPDLKPGAAPAEPAAVSLPEVSSSTQASSFGRVSEDKSEGQSEPKPEPAPGPPPEEPEALPADWNRPLHTLLGL